MTETEVRSDAISEYLAEISRYPLLTAEEEVELARQLREGSPRAQQLARDRLIQSNLRLVVSIARRYSGRGLGLMDLIQEGSIGLQTGIEKYDWRKGYRLSTYIFWWIRQAIVRALANNSREIRLPVHAGELLRNARHVEEQLQAELDRKPTLDEVSQHLHIQPDRLRDIRQAALSPISLDVPVGDEGTLTRGDTLIDESALNSLISAGEASELEADVAEIVQELPERERQVIQLRYGLGTPEIYNLSQIGRRLGVTRERARQLEGQALRRLRANARLRRALVELTAAS